MSIESYGDYTRQMYSFYKKNPHESWVKWLKLRNPHFTMRIAQGPEQGRAKRLCLANMWPLLMENAKDVHFVQIWGNLIWKCDESTTQAGRGRVLLQKGVPSVHMVMLDGSSVQDWSPHMSFILKGSQITACQLKGRFKSKTSIQEYKIEIQNSYWTWAWIICYVFSVQCEESRINHLTQLLVVTMPYACWFLWQAYYVDDFKWRLHFQFGVAFWRVVLREVYIEGPNCIWRALKTSILNTGWEGVALMIAIHDCLR